MGKLTDSLAFQFQQAWSQLRIMYFPTQLSGGGGPRCCTSQNSPGDGIISLSITSRKHLALQPSLGRLNNNSLLCPIVPAFFFLGSLPHPPSFWARRLDTGHEISPGVSRERSFLLGVGVCLGDKRRGAPGPHPGRAGLVLWGLVVGGGKGQRGCYLLWGCSRFQALKMSRQKGK